MTGTLARHVLSLGLLALALMLGLGAQTMAAGARLPRANHTQGVPVPARAAVPACPPDWHVVPSPDAGSVNQLDAVSAASAGDIWAVGFFYNSQDLAQALAMHWDGSTWTFTPDAVPNTEVSFLYGVASLPAGEAWAVGEHTAGTFPQPLIEHWNGSAWSIMPGPDPGSQGSNLHGIAAVTANDIWAVGSYSDGAGQARSLVVHWDGVQWSIVPSPNPGSTWNGLFSVAALSASDVWAVGYSRDAGSSPYRTLIEHWNGAQWSAVPSPNTGPDDNFLYGVAAVSADDIWAAGHSGLSVSGIHSVTMHWDGSQWSAAPNTGDASLRAVAAISPGDVWSAGIGLLMHWTGSTWDTTATSGSTSLHGAAALSSTDVWAVGSSDFHTLALHYSDPCTTPTPTATPLPSATASPTASATPTGTPMLQPTATATPANTATPTPCAISFSDVLSGDYFYEAVRYLYCRGIVSGYLDNTFRPYNSTTRGQLAKIIVLARGWPLYTPPTPTFRDVPTGAPFYLYVETAYHRQVISGYTCGTACLEYRPGNDVTREQLTKIVTLAMDWQIAPPAVPTFRDVPRGEPFYGYVETAYAHGVISGYTCGGGCLEFRPGTSATRGQISKIVHQAITRP